MEIKFIQRVIQASFEEPRIAFMLLGGILCGIKNLYTLLN